MASNSIQKMIQNDPEQCQIITKKWEITHLNNRNLEYTTFQKYPETDDWKLQLHSIPYRKWVKTNQSKVNNY